MFGFQKRNRPQTFMKLQPPATDQKQIALGMNPQSSLSPGEGWIGAKQAASAYVPAHAGCRPEANGSVEITAIREPGERLGVLVVGVIVYFRWK